MPPLILTIEIHNPATKQTARVSQPVWPSDELWPDVFEMWQERE